MVSSASQQYTGNLYQDRLGSAAPGHDDGSLGRLGQAFTNNFDPPYFVSDALSSIVGEPASDDVASWTSLTDVASCAKLKCDITWPPSMSGSLLRLLAGDDDPAYLVISEIASVSPSFFEAQLSK